MPYLASPYSQPAPACTYPTLPPARPQGLYESDGSCLACDASCLTCDLSASNCTSCASTSYYHALAGTNAGSCVAQCANGTYASSVRA